jgi:hypothetical protein
MTTPRTRTLLRRRAAAALAAAALSTSLLAGCGDGAETDCSLSQCTITFDRGEEGNANVLGVSVELVSASDSEAVVSVAGRETTIPLNQSREVAGLNVELTSITADEVVVVVSR